MRFFTNKLQVQATNPNRGLLAHWAWAIPILFVVAALSMRQIDLYPPTADEFYSMYNVGWLVGGPYTPFDVIESLYNTSPNHVPGYFIILNAWGITGYSIASARILGIFFGLLNLAMCFRLARDFAGPVTGLFAVILIASNAYYNYYLAHARMYTLLMLLGGFILWLYFRILFQWRPVRRRDFLALGVAVFLFLHAHALSPAFMLVLAAFHLTFAARDRKWNHLALTVVMAALLSIPAYLVVVLRGIPLSQRDWDSYATSSWETIAAWLELATNGQPLLVAIPVLALALAIRHKLPRLARLEAILMLVFIHFVVLAVLSGISNYVNAGNIRYILPTFLLFALLMAIGIQALYRHRRFLSLLVILWPIAGIYFQLGADWKQFLAGRAHSFLNPPWQVISRMASDTKPNPLIIGYQIPTRLVDHVNRISLSQRQHYFDRAGLVTRFSPDPHDFNLTIRYNSLVSPRIWIMYRSSLTATDSIAEIESAITNYDYELCATRQAGVDTVILDYAWSILDCAEPDSQLDAHTALHEIQFFGSEVSSNGAKLNFVDRWSSTVDFVHEDYRMSYQLISPDWDNVAQVDIPLVHEAKLRQFAIDIGNIAPGNYRLMAILYNIHTGDRLAWNSRGADAQEVLLLTEVDIE